MPTYSSRKFYKDWRYSIETDFVNPSGERVKYAPDGLRTWGSERYKIPFSKHPVHAALNCDGSLMGISVEDNIHIYDTVDFSQVLVCRGHLSNVDAFDFQPGNPKVLVSSAQNHRAGSHPAEPSIIVWDLNEMQAHPMIEGSVISSIASQATEAVVKNLLQVQPRIGLSDAEEKSLTSSIEPIISRIVKIHNTTSQKTLHGRLQKSFQSEIFSPSGAHLIYLPGNSPRSNDSDVWDIKIHSMSTHKDILTLTGHTDGVMWTGYSPDESMIGTVSWDKSMRIWDAADGHQKYKFDTSGQNWTGGFSPDSQRFAGTCGDGTFYVYAMSDGATLVRHKSDERSSWMRALSWSASSREVALGARHGAHPGSFCLYDVERKEVTQERILSLEACAIAPDTRRYLGGYLETCAVRFVDGGRKVVVLTSGDGGIETYDLETWEKWRFARPGIDPGLEAEVKNNEEENELEHGGYSMAVWEDPKRGKVWVASIDGDAVRIWDLPMTNDNDS
ncbi:hypothetical protein V490_08435 [Pseudogymnoascus sp. VKM F-3557]|nr:hypothetical protein V490_08435 [Pseudogymnoascus sp. VKM F-3557]